MGRRKSRSSHEYSHTPTTLMVALLGGSCAFIAVETTLPDVLDCGEPDEQVARMAIPYGIGVQWNRDILHILVPFWNCTKQSHA
jgi:hypothetical protein